MKLVLGLGNPGKEYEDTRHNIGFKCIDYMVKEYNLGNSKNKFNAQYWTYNVNNEKFIFAKPLSYMNLSGTPAICLAQYFNIAPKDIIVIYDDKDLEFSKVRIKKTGSSGGHNGIKNIIQCFKTDKIARIKIGIGFNQNYLIKDWVLSNFSYLEKEKLDFIYLKIKIIFDEIFKGHSLDKILNSNLKL